MKGQRATIGLSHANGVHDLVESLASQSVHIILGGIVDRLLSPEPTREATGMRDISWDGDNWSTGFEILDVFLRGGLERMRVVHALERII